MAEQLLVQVTGGRLLVSITVETVHIPLQHVQEKTYSRQRVFHFVHAFMEKLS